MEFDAYSLTFPRAYVIPSTVARNPLVIFAICERTMPDSFIVHVPATTANLGAGFDCLGLALDLRNSIAVEVGGAGLQIEIEGEGADSLPRDASNRVVVAMERVFALTQRARPPLRLRMTNRIPLARGLGSSAAAAVGGLLAANALCGGALSQETLLQLATELEGHPDNVAPALMGGLCVVAMDDGKPIAIRFDTPPTLRCVLFVPDEPLPTAQARAVLPASVPHKDAAFNASRAALWIAAITQQRLNLLRLATQDRLHQPYRAPLVRGFEAIVAAANEAGALGAFLSGAGSSIAALCEDGAERIAEAMGAAAQQAGSAGRMMVVGVSARGASVQGG